MPRMPIAFLCAVPSGLRIRSPLHPQKTTIVTPPSASYAEAPARTAFLELTALQKPVSKAAVYRGFRAITGSEELRRALNVAIASLGLIVAIPVMFVVAVLVKLSSPGPVFYTQSRVGVDRRTPGVPSGNHRRHVDYGGQIFRIYKFRTMRSGAPDAKQVWASNADPRITPIGRVLRKYRLDELPQLINVLRGEMNIVGPRPEQPEILVRLREAIPEYQRRQRVLPGITGWAQVNQSYDQDLDDVRRKVKFDIEYISRRSALEDLRIMAQTVPVMLLRKGAI
jgi:lipopolysaccharide/colanic/teichoic acid biosynthesis glycosyltransferase